MARNVRVRRKQHRLLIWSRSKTVKRRRYVRNMPTWPKKNGKEVIPLHPPEEHSTADEQTGDSETDAEKTTAPDAENKPPPAAAAEGSSVNDEEAKENAYKRLHEGKSAFPSTSKKPRVSTIETPEKKHIDDDENTSGQKANLGIPPPKQEEKTETNSHDFGPKYTEFLLKWGEQKRLKVSHGEDGPVVVGPYGVHTGDIVDDFLKLKLSMKTP